MRGRLSIIAGRSNQPLAARVAKGIGVELTACDSRRFSDGELSIEIRENVRGSDVFAVQPTCSPSDTNLMELLLMIDALKRASADRIIGSPPTGARASTCAS